MKHELYKVCVYICDTKSHVQQYECSKPVSSEFQICVDKCLIDEIKHLWNLGIKTTGCCCGHHVNSDKNTTAFIGVEDEYINRMKELGYSVLFNPCRPNDEDSFIPKTIIINK